MKLCKLVLAMVVCSLVFLPVFSMAADMKIGVVDFQRVLRESTPGKAAKAEIEKKGTELEQKLKKEGEELERIRKQLEADALVMSREVRDQKERDFRIKMLDFKENQKKYAMDFKDLETEVIKRVQKDVFQVVEMIGKQGGYTLILERAMLVYHISTVDITDELIKEYNKKG